jgi:hypothetical protein
MFMFAYVPYAILVLCFLSMSCHIYSWIVSYYMELHVLSNACVVANKIS